jgi:hypothetical protein
MNTLFVHIVEQRPQPGEFVRRADAVTQRVVVGYSCAGATRSWVKGGEVLAGDGPCQQTAQRFATLPFGTHAGP